MTEGETRRLTLPKQTRRRVDGYPICALRIRLKKHRGNACRKAAYNQREEIRCDRTGELFSFKERGGNAHHEILLPEGIHEKFKDSATLWNEVEGCEKRKDSQLAKEFVIALPDDAQVTFEDRLELTHRFANTHFVEKGLGVPMCHDRNIGIKNLRIKIIDI